jgi:hypothetical protein
MSIINFISKNNHDYATSSAFYYNNSLIAHFFITSQNVNLSNEQKVAILRFDYIKYCDLCDETRILGVVSRLSIDS